LSLNRFYIDLKYNRQVGSVVFNGGTVRARQNTVNFLGETTNAVEAIHGKWLTNIIARVRGGAIIDTAGFNIEIKSPLLAGMDEEGDEGLDGGLIKRGLGTLTLSGTNTYTGPTVVEAGTLLFNLDTPLPPTNMLIVCDEAVCDVNNRALTVARLGGNGIVQRLTGKLVVTDALAPTDGTLTVDGQPASIAGCALEVRVGADGAHGRLHVNGDLDLSQLTLAAVNPAELDRAYSYIVASCTGALTGTFSGTSGLPPCWRIQINQTTKSVRLVYDFGTTLIVK
jgi:autotransporter-associated beta strand protein